MHTQFVAVILADTGEFLGDVELSRLPTWLEENCLRPVGAGVGWVQVL